MVEAHREDEGAECGSHETDREIVNVSAISISSHLPPTRFRRNSDMSIGDRLPSNSPSRPGSPSRRRRSSLVGGRRDSVTSAQDRRASGTHRPAPLSMRLFGQKGKGRWIISPNSTVAYALLYVSTFLLLYTGMAVPVIIAFFWDNPDPCWRNPLLPFDIFVDTFFIFEILINFRKGTHDKGVYTEDAKQIARKYICGDFPFDLATSIPVSYVEFFALQQCDSDTSTDLAQLRFTRLVKPLRLIRLIKVLRAIRDLAVVGVVERFFKIPPIAFRMARVVFNIACVTHMVSCTFWFTKVVSSEPAEVVEFLESNGLPGEAATLSQKYIISTYFTCTVFTTVGFGDISASNSAEQLLCIGMMLLGVMVFGTLLSEVEGGIFEMRRFTREKNHILYQLKNFLRHKEVSSASERQLLNWVEFEVDVQQRVEWEEECQRFFSPQMRAAIDSAHAKAQLSNLEVLELELSPEQQEQLYAKMWEQSYVVTFQKGQSIASEQAPLSGMYILEQGSVRVEDDIGTQVQLLNAGEVFGEPALLGDTLLESEYGIPVTLIANSHVCATCFTASDFEQILQTFPGAHEALAHKAARRLMDLRGMFGRTPSTCTQSYYVARARWLSLVRKLQRAQKLAKVGQSFARAFAPASIASLTQKAREGVTRANSGAPSQRSVVEAAISRPPPLPSGRPHSVSLSSGFGSLGAFGGAGPGAAGGPGNKNTNKFRKGKPANGDAKGGGAGVGGGGVEGRGLNKRVVGAKGAGGAGRMFPNAALGAARAGGATLGYRNTGGAGEEEAGSGGGGIGELRQRSREAEGAGGEGGGEGREKWGGEGEGESGSGESGASVRGGSDEAAAPSAGEEEAVRHSWPRRASAGGRLAARREGSGSRGGRGGVEGRRKEWLARPSSSGLLSSFAFHREASSVLPPEEPESGFRFRVQEVEGERGGHGSGRSLQSGVWQMAANSEEGASGAGSGLAGEVERLSGEMAQVKQDVGEILSILREMRAPGPRAGSAGSEAGGEARSDGGREGSSRTGIAAQGRL